MSLRIAFLLTLLSPAATAPVLAQSLGSTANFDLHLAGKSVGHDIYTLSKSGKGYKLASHLTGTVRNTDFDFKDSFTYSGTYAYIDGAQTSQAANQQISYLPDRALKEMTVAVAVAGRTSSAVEPIGPNLLLLPPFDAGAAQALLLHCITSPTPDNLYNLYLTPGYSLGIPANAAPAADQTLPSGVHMFSALWAKGRDVTGTLDGKPVTLHTYQLAFGKYRWIFFADPDNNLMQVNVSLLHGAYIREHFQLDPIR